MFYYEQLALGRWSPRTTTLDAPKESKTVRYVATVAPEHRNLSLRELATIYGEEARHVEETTRLAEHLHTVADDLAAQRDMMGRDELANLLWNMTWTSEFDDFLKNADTIIKAMKGRA